MERSTIDRLIIDSPYAEPRRYWSYNREARAFSLQDGGGLQVCRRS
jgi:type III restriction enzyme